MEAKFLWMWIKDIFPYSDTVVYKLQEIFGSIENIYGAQKSDFKEMKGLDAEKIKKLCDKSLDKVYATYEKARKIGAEAVCIADSVYPERLRHCHNPPPVLYVRGDVTCMEGRLVIAGVGTRDCTSYGRNIAKLIAADLSAAGAVIVSGMAKGIDTAAHTGALSEGGKTVAVLGTAIDKIYPAENREMYYKISENGAVVSEHPPGYPGSKFDFQLRNRIIAGLSDGVFICQAPKRSGSLITARMALDMGRDLFCVAGNAEAVNEGSNRMIMEGCAKMILGATDILDEYEIYKEAYKIGAPTQEIKSEPAPKRDYSNLSDIQRKIVEAIGGGSVLADELCEALKMDYGALASQITQLELFDVIENNNGSITLK